MATHPVEHQAPDPSADGELITDDISNIGKSNLQGLKHRYDLTEDRNIEYDFEQTVSQKVLANAGVTYNTNTWIFELPPYIACSRWMYGLIEIRFKLHPAGGGNFPDNIENFGNNAAFIRPCFGPNLIDSITVIVNGQNIYTQEDHGIINYVMDLLTMKEEDYPKRNFEYGAGIYKRRKINPEASRTADNGLSDAVKATDMGPNTSMSVANTYQQNIVAVQEQKEYTDMYCKYLPGSKEWVMMFRMHHPMFHTNKFMAPDFSCQIMVKLATPGQLFQCASTHVPKVEYTKVVYHDHLIKLERKPAELWAERILSHKNGLMIYPITRHIIEHHNVPNGNHFTIRAFQGRIPQRCCVFFVENGAFHAGSSERNPFDFKFWGVTEAYAKFAMKKYPDDDGIKIQGLPNTAAGVPYTKAQKEDIIRLNWPEIKRNMSTFVGEENVHKLYAKYEDFLDHCAVWTYDFTPLCNVQGMPQTDFPNRQGFCELFFRLQVAPQPTDSITCVCLGEYNNTLEFVGPTYQSNNDFTK